MNKKIGFPLLVFVISSLFFGMAFAQVRPMQVKNQLKEDYQKTREEFLEIRQKAKTPEAQQMAVEKGKEMAKKMAERIIKQAEALKVKVNAVKDLSEADKTQIISRIDEHIAALNEIKIKIDAATTKEHLREITKELRLHLTTAKRFSKHFVGRLLVHRINKGIERVETAIQKAETKIAELKTAGKDVAKLEGLINEAKTHLDLAKAEYQKAKDKYQEALTVEDFAKIAKEANRFAKAANKHLILAHKAVQRLIPEINKLIRLKEPVQPTEQPEALPATPTPQEPEPQVTTETPPESQPQVVPEEATPTVE